jgi:hypothetical protein
MQAQQVDSLVQQAQGKISQAAITLAKSEFVKMVQRQNLRYPELYSEVARYTAPRVRYVQLQVAQGNQLQVTAFAKGPKEIGLYLQTMYQCPLFSAVNLTTQTPGYATGGGGATGALPGLGLGFGGGAPPGPTVGGLAGAAGGAPSPPAFSPSPGLGAGGAAGQGASPAGLMQFQVVAILKEPITPLQPPAQLNIGGGTGGLGGGGFGGGGFGGGFGAGPAPGRSGGCREGEVEASDFEGVTGMKVLSLFAKVSIGLVSTIVVAAAIYLLGIRPAVQNIAYHETYNESLRQKVAMIPQAQALVQAAERKVQEAEARLKIIQQKRMPKNTINLADRLQAWVQWHAMVREIGKKLEAWPIKNGCPAALRRPIARFHPPTRTRFRSWCWFSQSGRCRYAPPPLKPCLTMCANGTRFPTCWCWLMGWRFRAPVRTLSAPTL